jgi:hemolysin III
MTAPRDTTPWIRDGRADGPIERAADAVVLIASLLLGVAAVAVLMLRLDAGTDALTRGALAVYGAGLLAMLACSALYNLNPRPHLRPVLRRLDRAAIFVMIAGTYTPFALVAIGGAWGMGLFAAVWLGAVAGILFTLLRPGRYDRLATASYLVLGWLVLVAIEPLVRAVSAAGLALLAAGGVLYSAGVGFHLWRRLPGQNAIWHGFVLAAAACHYAAVMIEIA